jgi:hypothetical protein
MKVMERYLCSLRTAASLHPADNPQWQKILKVKYDAIGKNKLLSSTLPVTRKEHWSVLCAEEASIWIDHIILCKL